MKNRIVALFPIRMVVFVQKIILWFGNFLLRQEYSEYYFLKMNVFDDLYTKRRQFKEPIQKLINLHNNKEKLNEVILRDGRVIIVAEPYQVQYYFHPEIDIDNSGENADVMFRSIKRDQNYLDYIISKLESKSVFIDVGANLGHFSLQVAKQTNCTCYSFEPLPINLKNLKENIELNALNNIFVVPFALGDKKGHSYFSTNLAVQANRIVKEKDFNSIEIECTTLDDFAYENKIEKVDFIKADIQGAEFLFLKGAEKTIKRCKPYIMLESDDLSLQFGYKREEMFKWLHAIGYPNFLTINGDIIENHNTLDSSSIDSHIVDFIFYPEKL
jgi:FkbM family methyltransferase